MNFLLHAEGGGGFFSEVVLHGLLETLKILPFLFLTYLLMEFIEHRSGDKLERFIEKSGPFGPLLGGLLGTVPQCGFSSVGANLYTGRVISIGTMIAVFLSTSDEMLPILISGRYSAKTIIGILLYKSLCAILVGFLVNLIAKLMGRSREKINIDAICEEDGCHCDGGILRSAIHHTVSISIFILLITVLINSMIFLLGEERIAEFISGVPYLSHLIAALFGLIPNCAASVALTELYTEGLISMGTMLSGLFSGCGVGVLVLWRVNKKPLENLAIMGILFTFGVILGIVADLIGLSGLIA